MDKNPRLTPTVPRVLVCQHHSHSSVSCCPIKESLPQSVDRICSPGSSPEAGAWPPQKQTLEFFLERQQNRKQLGRYQLIFFSKFDQNSDPQIKEKILGNCKQSKDKEHDSQAHHSHTAENHAVDKETDFKSNRGKKAIT